MKFKRWQYNLCLHKTYFDTGYGITSYMKYVIALVGGANVLLFEGTLLSIAILGLGYGVFCYFFGLIWYKWNFIYAQNEVGNLFNLFQKEVRAELQNGKVFKGRFDNIAKVNNG